MYVHNGNDEMCDKVCCDIEWMGKKGVLGAKTWLDTMACFGGENIVWAWHVYWVRDVWW